MSLVLENRTTGAPAPDLAAIKQRQQATWASGDYAVIGTTLQIVGESLAEAADVRAGERVLDVAAGNGNATLAAARRFAEVTSTDYVPALLDKGRAARARPKAWTVRFQVADAEALPFADGSFDVVLSTFGAMFTPDHARSGARDAARAAPRRPHRPGQLDARGLHRPAVQGHRRARAAAGGAASRRRCGAPRRTSSSCSARSAASIRCERRHFNFRYRSAAHWLQVFRDFYGPTHKAFAALDAAGQAALERDITALLERAERRRPVIAGRARASTSRSSSPSAEARRAGRAARVAWQSHRGVGSGDPSPRRDRAPLTPRTRPSARARSAGRPAA